jgi:microcystin-dependent protein
MVGQRYYTPNPFEIDPNGVPLAGAQLFFYLTQNPGTFLSTFQDVDLTTENPNPVIADNNGRFGSIFLSPSQAYNVQLFTAPTDGNPGGAQIWSEDPVGPAAGGVQTNISGILGEVRAFAGVAAAVPAQWQLCFGQAISRTTFVAAFTVLGTTWGIGDGSTTFNLPDLRGRGLFGVDNMGGAPVGLVTSGGSGISGITLGSIGGSQFIQSHTHAVTDPGHVHAITDPGHQHPLPLVFAAGTTSPVLEFGAGSIEELTSTETATTGIVIDNAQTGITIGSFGAGASQNMPPAAMVNMIIFLGA